MILLPGHLVANYQTYCRRCGISDADRADYLKWLRFFFDFSEKYHVTGEDSQRISLFTDKLKEKKQGEEQRQRAHHAVSLYFEMIKGEDGTQLSRVLSPTLDVKKTQADEEAVSHAPVNSVRKSFHSDGFLTKPMCN